MSTTKDQVEVVADCYNNVFFDYESKRLSEHSPVEGYVTQRYFDRFIGSGLRVRLFSIKSK
jgi:hypothetical protein